MYPGDTAPLELDTLGMSPSVGWAGSGLGGVEVGTIAYPAVNCYGIEPGGRKGRTRRERK